MNESDVKDSLREWIAKKSGKVTPGAIRDDTPILEERIISSLHVMELMLYVERLRNRPLDIDEIRPGAFKDIGSIYAQFFKEAA